MDPICGKFDKFSAHGQAHMQQMGKWAWQCTTTGLDNSIELRTEKIHQAVTEIWVPQVWQPPARPTARPPARTVTTIPLQPGGLRGKKQPTGGDYSTNGQWFREMSNTWSWLVSCNYETKQTFFQYLVDFPTTQRTIPIISNNICPL